MQNTHLCEKRNCSYSYIQLRAPLGICNTNDTAHWFTVPVLPVHKQLGKGDQTRHLVFLGFSCALRTTWFSTLNSKKCFLKRSLNKDRKAVLQVSCERHCFPIATIWKGVRGHLSNRNVHVGENTNTAWCFHIKLGAIRNLTRELYKTGKNVWTGIPLEVDDQLKYAEKCKNYLALGAVTFYPSALQSKAMQPSHLSLLRKLSIFASLIQTLQMSRDLKYFQL